MRSASILDGKPIIGQEIDFWGAAVGASGAACLGTAGQVVSPGDTWRTQSQFPIPGYRDSSISVSTLSRFEGYQGVNGKEWAVIQDSSQTLLTGRILMEQNQKPPLLIQVYLDSVKASSNATFYVDPQTGRAMAARSFSPPGEIGATIVTTAPGRPPVVQPIHPQNVAQVFVEMTVEYLP